MPEFMSVMLADDGVVFVSVCCLALSQMALSDVFLRIREKNFMRGRLELIAHAEHRLQRDLPHMYLSRNGMMIFLNEATRRTRHRFLSSAAESQRTSMIDHVYSARGWSVSKVSDLQSCYSFHIPTTLCVVTEL